jgi:UDPglucose 6-dehydrogenase
MSLVSAELTKLACNMLRAQSVSTINALNILCHGAGANIDHVMSATGLQSGTDYSWLKPGLGFGGRCLEKDTRCLASLAASMQHHPIASYFSAITDANDYIPQQCLQTIDDWFGGSLQDVEIAILGFAFKRDTGDIRRSVVVRVAQELLQRGAIVRAFDPYIAGESIAASVGERASSGRLLLFKDAYSTCQRVDLVFLGTDEEAFDQLDWQRICDSLKRPRRFFEARGNRMRMGYMRQLGMEVRDVGMLAPS